MTQPRYTYNVGDKFHADGTPRTWPGNTIICFADPDDTPYKEALWIQEEFTKLPFAHKYAMLPASSLHMTLMGLVNHEQRAPHQWSQHLSLNTSMDDADCYIIQQLSSVPEPNNFRMKYVATVAMQGLTIVVTPADEATMTSIWQYREAIAQATGVRRPDFFFYEFHISLAYCLIELTPEERWTCDQFLQQVNERLHNTFGIFNTGKPHLTFFDDMFSFAKLAERPSLVTRNPDACHKT